jgi:CelD/BcsL family acetyltransferase involved in cellulose biosynthesis
MMQVSAISRRPGPFGPGCEARPKGRALRDGLSVECVDDESKLTALRPQWNELLRASAADGPFLTWEWLHSWWKHLHGVAALKVVAVRDGNELIAIAPLMITPGAVPWFSRLEFLGSGHAGSDYLDVIVRIGRETEALRAIARFLRTQRMTLRLGHLPDVSLGAQLAERLASEGWVSSVAPGGVCPVIPLAGHTWDSYLATLGSAHRANVRRRLRGVSQLGMRFERVTSESRRREALEALAGFHERRFRTDGGSTAFLTPALRVFQDDATRRALDRGWLRMYVLWLNDVPAAVMYGFFYNRQFYFYQHGFDDRYARHSVGLVLMALTIRAAIDEGAQEFDLLWGTEPYKWLWTRETRTLRQIHLFPPHAAGMIHRHAVDARRRLGRLARRLLTPGEDRGPSA